MQALGLIETRGLIAAIESADAMLKAAEVSLLEKTYVGGGLVSVAVTGDVAAVKAAVEAGGAAVKQLNHSLLLSQHVIPRPNQELGDVIVAATPLKNKEVPVAVTEEVSVVVTEKALPKVTEEPSAEQQDISKETPAELHEKTTEDTVELHKEALDKMVLEDGLEKTIAVLNKLKVVKLRNLAREYKDFGIAGRLISKADKHMLVEEFRRYFGQK